MPSPIPTFTFSYDELLVCFGIGLYTLEKELNYDDYSVQIIRDCKTKEEGFEVRYIKLPLRIRYQIAPFDSMYGKKLNTTHRKEAKERCESLIEEMLKHISPTDFTKWINAVASHSYSKGRQSLKDDFKKLLERD
jgi:hypothetical protein